MRSIAEFLGNQQHAYSAQFGGNGAVVNTASKSGTNSFHGSAYEFFRNSDLDARNFFDRPMSGTCFFAKNSLAQQSCGPSKDKLFFFFNDEELRKSEGSTVPSFIPDANMLKGLVPCNLAPNITCAGGLANVGVSAAAAPVLALYPATTVGITDWHPAGAGSRQLATRR